MIMKVNLLFFLLSLAICACSENDPSLGTVGSAVPGKEITGVSQKGPFLVGSSVTVQELDGNSLNQTGKSFKATIKSKNGGFAVNVEDLISQYVLLEIKGYYYNEVTGKNSEGVIMLNAIADLNDRDRVNVNVFTHLVTDRVLHLVQKQGMSFADAKKQAEKEIYSAFGFVGELPSPEDMNILSIDDGAGALLAASVLLQNEGTSADLSERLALVSLSIADSGVWNDSIKAEIADWAMYATKTGWLERHVRYWISIFLYPKELRRDCLEEDSCPISPFEKFINSFWSNVYGLGVCSESNKGEVKLNENKESRFYKHAFACNDSLRWMINAEYLQNKYYEMNSDGETKKRWSAANMRCGLSSFEEPEKRCGIYGGVFSFDNADSACKGKYGYWLDGVYYRFSHVPTRAEMQSLIDSYDGAAEAAAGLRSPSGFAALLGGYHDPDVDSLYVGFGESAMFWTSTSETIDGDVYYYFMRVDSNEAVIDSTRNPNLEMSVRCVVENGYRE